MAVTRLEVRQNSDELLRKANDYFEKHPKVVITDSPPNILSTLREEVRFYERPNKYTQ